MKVKRRRSYLNTWLIQIAFLSKQVLPLWLSVLIKVSFAIFLIIVEPVKSIEDFGKYVYSDDMSPKIRKMMKYGIFFFHNSILSYNLCLSCIAFMSYYTNTIFNFCFGWIIDFCLWFARLFHNSPSRITNQAWSFQQGSFLIENLVLLAQSKGISSVIMEGFIEKGVKECCNIPKR